MTYLKTMIIAGAAVAIAGPSLALEQYRIGGGPAGGAWHPAVSAGAQLLNAELKGTFKFHYSPSNGSVDNVRRVALGDFDTAWGHVGQVYQAWNGIGLFKKDGKSHDFRIIGNVRKQTQIIAVLADSPIKSFSDMKGKVVNLLAKGSGSNVNCQNIFKAIGLIDKIKARYLGFSAAGRALGDRQVDVYCSAGAPFTIPALTELSLRKPVRYISMTAGEQKKLTSNYQFYAAATIPVQKDVKGMNSPALSIGYDVWWIVSKQMSDQAVYDIVSVIANPANLKRLATTASYWKSLSGRFDALATHNIFVHPAAAKYWRERGAKIPNAIVHGF